MRLPANSEAIEITQGLLDTLDAAFIAKDFEAYAPALHVPHHIRTKKEVFDIRSIEELKVGFERYCDYADELGATSCKRTCTKGRFCTVDRIEATHSVSYFAPDGTLVVPTAHTTSILMRIEGEWRICGSDNTTRISTGIADALRNAAQDTQAHLRSADKRPRVGEIS